MKLSHLSIGSLIAYISYYKQMLSIKDNVSTKELLEQFEKEYDTRKIQENNRNSKVWWRV